MPTDGGPFTRRKLINKIDLFTASLANYLPMACGTILYVHATDGVDAAGRGDDPATPLATLDYAIGLIAGQAIETSNNVIVLMGGHAENVATAGAINFDAGAIHVIGLGTGRNRPKFTWTATDATMLVGVANIHFENIVFDFTGIDAVVVGIKVDAADVSFKKCEFVTNAAAAGVVSGITVGATTTSPRFRVEDCEFLGPATNSGTTTTAQITLTAGVDYIIRRNYFTGKMTQAITNGAALLRGLIDDNRFQVYTGTKGINMHASSTPLISNNRFNVPSGTAPVVAAAGFVVGNAYSAAAGVTAGTALTW